MSERSTRSRLVASRWFDVGLAALVTALCIAELAAHGDLGTYPFAPVLLIVLAVPIALRRSHPVAAVGIEAVVLVATPDLLPDSLILVSVVGVSLVVYSCGAHAPRREGAAAVVALMAAMQVRMGFSEFPNVEIAFVTLGPWWVGAQVGRKRRLVRDLADRTAELEAEQDALARLSVRHERARIAHELHDIVAHHLAVIVVQAGAGRMASADGGEQAGERLGAIRQSGEQALAEMARLVDVLHSDRRESGTALGRLRILVDEANAGGVRVGLNPLPPGVRLPAAVEESAYRVVREGLTNAIKHAPGSEVQVKLAARGDELDVEVHNASSGDVSTLAATGSGLGLSGMRERVESLGGTLEAGRGSDGGWRLAAHLPIAAAAER